MCCFGLPQPRSSRIAAAATRARGGALGSIMMPASVLVALRVYDLAKDSISAMLFAFLGIYEPRDLYHSVYCIDPRRPDKFQYGGIPRRSSIFLLRGPFLAAPQPLRSRCIGLQSLPELLTAGLHSAL
jgi:hypothetical protein